MNGRVEMLAQCGICEVQARQPCKAWCPNHPTRVKAMVDEADKIAAAIAANGSPMPGRLELLMLARRNLGTTAKT